MISSFSLVFVATVTVAPGNLALSVSFTFCGSLSGSTFSSCAKPTCASHTVSAAQITNRSFVFIEKLLEVGRPQHSVPRGPHPVTTNSRGPISAAPNRRRAYFVSVTFANRDLQRAGVRYLPILAVRQRLQYGKRNVVPNQTHRPVGKSRIESARMRRTPIIVVATAATYRP